MASTVLRSPNLSDGAVPLVVRLYERPPPTPFRSGGLARAAEHVRGAGRAGDDVLLHINPAEYEFLKSQWGEPSLNPHTGLPEYGFFSKLKKALKFESFNIKGIIKDIAKNPQRLLVGAVDPLGTKIANTVLGTDWKPVVNQLGGATKQRFADAEAKGYDTGLAKDLHNVAGAIAGFYGGNALGNLASTGLGNVGSSLQGVGGTAATDAGAITEFVPTVSKVGEAAANTGSSGALSSLAEYTPNVSYIDSAGNATNALTEFTPTVKYTGDFANTATGRAAIDAARYGQDALADLGDKAIDYAKQPKNWSTIAKAAGALGVLGSAGATPTEGQPPAVSSPGLKQLPFGRTQAPQDFDWYSYGERPEQAFYSSNIIPEFTPDEEEPGLARGGSATRFVRGPGTGRSDSIDAKLSDGEYVLTAEDVALLGDGSSEAGARRLDEFRTALRKHKGGALSRGKISPNAKSPMAYLKGVR